MFCVVLYLILLLQIHGCFSVTSEGYALLHFRAKLHSNPSRALSDGNTGNVTGILWTVEESSNLLAFSPNAAIPIGSQTVPSRSSGSFPAIPIPKNVSPAPSSQPKPATKNSGVPARFSVELSGGIIIMFIVAASAVFLSRSRAVKTIRSWKTGLSGQLQKAFISGVPKVKRGELEVASEDFSNIIISDDEGVYTIYKGTLSSGVEIAVASTDLTSTKQWSRRSESVFRKKIDTLSRMNHKNFLNLVGYCEEDEPFTRMMVFEYAPNGTLHEHLHVADTEHLDWISRTRILMGIAYCLQHLHNLNPPVPPLPDFTSRSIFLTNDYAAKIGDIYFWEEFIRKRKKEADADAEANVYSFGLLLLEIISGRDPSSEDLIAWGGEYLNDEKRYSCLVDSSLESFKGNELDVICEVIGNCIQEDPGKRLSMDEIVRILYKEIGISPERATPGVSPLWWAELEILSA